MKDELEKKLFDDFPLLYVDKDASIQESLIPFGFECSDGWFELIYELSEKLEAIIKKHIDDGKAKEGEHPRAAQVKEKFGELRFYMTSYLKEFNDIITEAEMKSMKTCEKCGNPGKRRTIRRWLSTMCDKCYEENTLSK